MGSRTLFGSQAPNWSKYYMGGAHKGREFGNWQSDNAWDIFAPKGTPVFAIAPGTVSLNRVSKPPTAADKVYGDQVEVSSADPSIPSFFYTHIKSAVTKGQPVKTGDLIGHIMAHEANPQMPIHVHVGISGKRHIKDFIKEDGTLILAAPEGLLSIPADFDEFMNKNALAIASVGVAIMTVSLLSGRRAPAYANPASHLTVAR